MNKYIQALERVAKISAQIYKVTSLAFARTKQICCPHGNCPSYPTHAWWCDQCWLELKEALDELESFQQSVEPTAPRIKAGEDFSYMLSQQVKK